MIKTRSQTDHVSTSVKWKLAQQFAAKACKRLVVVALAASLGGCLVSKEDLVPTSDRVKVLPDHVILIGVDAKGRLLSDSMRKPVVYSLAYDENRKAYTEKERKDYYRSASKLKNGYFLVSDKDIEGVSYYLIKFNGESLFRYSEEKSGYKRWFKAAGLESDDPSSVDFVVRNNDDLMRAAGILIDHAGELPVTMYRVVPQ